MRDMTPVSPAVQVLRKIYLSKAEKNPRYSLRAFSRTLGLSHSLISLIFAGKRRLSESALKAVLARLELNKTQRRILLKQLGAQTDSDAAHADFNHISEERFTFISEWQHYAILSLLETPDFNMDPEWIAQRLNISPILALDSVQRLTKLDLIRNEGGTWVQSGGFIRFNNKKSTNASRTFHKNLIMKSIDSLENDSFEIRNHSGITFPMDPKDIPYAMKRIREFRLSLSDELSEKGKKNEVYNLCIQLFPLTRIQENK